MNQNSGHLEQCGTPSGCRLYAPTGRSPREGWRDLPRNFTAAFDSESWRQRARRHRNNQLLFAAYISNTLALESAPACDMKRPKPQAKAFVFATSFGQSTQRHGNNQRTFAADISSNRVSSQQPTRLRRK